MNEIYLFIIEIFIGLSITACVIFILSKPLKNVLIDICGTEVRAKFWVMYTNLMLVITPLLTSIIFGKLHRVAEASFSFYKTAFGSVLFGVFISLVIIGLQITKLYPEKMISSKTRNRSQLFLILAKN